MSFSNTWEQIKEDAHEELDEAGIVRTKWSFFGQGNRAPGFLTPWSEEAGVSDALWELCVNAYSNIKVLVLAIVSIFPVTAFATLELLFDSDPDEKFDFGDSLAILVAIPYYALSFVTDLAVSFIAMVTRTLATLGTGLVDVLSDCFDSDHMMASTGVTSAVR